MEDGWGRTLWAEFRGLRIHLGLVLSCSLLVNLKKWHVRVGHWRPLTPATLACPQAWVCQKSVTSWEMVVSDHIDLSFCLSPYGRT